MLNALQKNCISLAMVATICGIFILFVPFQISLIVLLAFMICIGFFRFPKVILAVFSVYLLFQGFVAFQFEKIPQLEAVIKRSEEGLVLTFFLITIIKNASLNKILWRRSDIDIPLSLLVVIAICSSIKNRIVPYQMAFFDLFLLLKGFMVFYIFYSLKFSSENLSKTMKAFFGLAVIVLMLGIVDLIAPQSFRALIHSRQFVEYRFGIPSVQSIFIHPGVFGWFMAFSACFALAFYSVVGKKKYLFLFVMFLFGLILSMRFKPMIGILFAGLLPFFIISGKRRIKFIAIACCLLLLLGVFFGARAKLLIDDKVHTYLRGPRLENVARNVLYSTGFRIAKDFFPFGSGLGTFGGWIAAIYYSPLYSRYGISSVYGLEKDGHFLTDTFWPYITGQFGFIGILMYVWILFSFSYTMMKIFKRTDDLIVKAFALGVMMVLVEAVFESVAQPIFLSPPPYFFIFACLGLANSRLIEHNDSKNILG